MIIAMLSAQGLVGVLVSVVVIAMICWLLWWFIGYCGLPEPFNKVARVIIALVAILFLISALLSLVGRSFIAF